MPNYSFESFVVGAASRDAFNAAVAVAGSPSAVHNPLVLYGPTRSGKTHLLYAIEGAMRARGMNVLRAPTADFVNRIIGAIHKDQMQALHQSLDSFEALLLDDFFIADSRPRTLQELLHQVERLVLQSIQIVLTTHVAPEKFPILRKWTELHHGTIATLATEVR